MRKVLFVALLVLFASSGVALRVCQAEVRLPKLLASQMVLQRDAEVTIWGWAEAGEAVQVTGSWFAGELKAVADAEGNWQVRLKPEAVGGPHTLTIEGSNTITLTDILFGEVWIASGQSNMEMPLGNLSGTYSGIKNSAEEIAAADYPMIRLFQAGNFSSKEPADDVDPGVSMYGVPKAACRWDACSPETIPNFAATAYFFARELHRELNVPIGIIDASWGGTRIESWMPAAGLKKRGYDEALEQTASLPDQPGVKISTRLYNGMIHPLRKFKIRGFLWYQGEQNAAEADKYFALFATMILQWRKSFGDMYPFYFVQAAPYNYKQTNAANLREAQRSAAGLHKTGMAVTLDIGDLKDVHPKNKQEVGRRLALWALAKDYGRELPYSGPLFRESIIKDGYMRLLFEHAEGGLTTRDGKAPSHFEVAGADKVFHPANTRIVGESIFVWADQVEVPRAVRYAFTSQGEGNLTNQAGLPASSFLIERW